MSISKKINEKPEHYVAETSIITAESVKPSAIKTESVKPSIIKTESVPRGKSILRSIRKDTSEDNS